MKNNETLKYQDPAIDELSILSRRPDLVVIDSIKKEISVYELKPESCRNGYKNNNAKQQLEVYIEALTKNSVGFSVKGGDEIPDGLALSFFDVGITGTITFTADPKVPGLYFYSIDDGRE